MEATSSTRLARGTKHQDCVADRFAQPGVFSRRDHCSLRGVDRVRGQPAGDRQRHRRRGAEQVGDRARSDERVATTRQRLPAGDDEASRYSYPDYATQQQRCTHPEPRKHHESTKAPGRRGRVAQESKPQRRGGATKR